jgi:C1A family cysteine protease
MPVESLPLEPGYRRIGGYGWKPDLPDHRDFLFAAAPAIVAALPAKVDLRPGCPPVYNQGQLGSCTANAIAAAIEFDLKKESLPEFTPSRLFIYYNERVLEGTSPSVDSGAAIRDGIKSVAAQGVCKEASWPYDDTNTDPNPCPKCKFAKKPSPNCYKEALQRKVKAYQRLNSAVLNTLKGCLAGGYPFVFGFTVYQSFEGPQVAQTGIVSMPGPLEKTVGGHAVVAVGYDDSTQRFIVRNSWGAGWGIQGYCMMPYDYLTNTNLADDFWAIQTI